VGAGRAQGWAPRSFCAPRASSPRGVGVFMKNKKSKVWKTPWGAVIEVGPGAARRFLEAAVRRLREFMEVVEAATWGRLLEAVEGEEAWGENPHARELKLPAWLQGLFWLLDHNPTFTRWGQVVQELSELLTGLRDKRRSFWAGVVDRGARALQGGRGLPPHVRALRAWLEERGLDPRSRRQVAAALAAAIEEVEAARFSRLQEAFELTLLEDAAYQAARDALAELEAALERGRLSREAAAALGMAAALGKSSPWYTPGELMSLGAEAALEAAARWREGGVPYPVWVFVHAEHRVGEKIARGGGIGGKGLEAVSLDALVDEEGNPLLEPPVEDLSGELAWRLDVRAALEETLGRAAAHALLVWAEEGVEGLMAFLNAPAEARSQVETWVNTQVETLRALPRFRSLWEEI